MIKKYKIGMNPNSRNGFKKGHKDLVSLKSRKKIALKMIGNKNALGYRHTEKAKRKIKRCSESRQPTLGKHWKVKDTFKMKKSKSEEHKKNISKARIEWWQNSENYRRMFKAFAIKPTRPEIFLTKFLNKILPREYKYTGDAQFILRGKCPDFLNINGKKKLIEYNSRYFHSKEITGETTKMHEQNRINHFKKFGFDTLILRENELKNLKKLKNKIITFNYASD